MILGNFKKLIRGNQFRSVLEDFVIPFAVGFALVSAFFWLKDFFTIGDPILEELPPEDSPEVDEIIPQTFFDKNGQLFLKRHGIQENEADVYKAKPDPLEFTIQAKASKQFKTEYVPRKFTPGGDPVPEPPGTIWPWPRIEKEAHALPLVWVVTPTYRNPYQYAELTRVAQAIYPARRFVRWLVVDDTKHHKFKRHIGNLGQFLNQFNVNFTVLKAKPRPAGQKVKFKPKGVEARRTAVDLIRTKKLQGVVYFADDDNTYDSDIFRQIQSTKTVSYWPTGAITQWTISGPVVAENGSVVDFFDAWVANRDFPVDFASFAVHTDLIHNNPEANIPWIQGYEESVFLKTLNVDKSQFLPLAANATQVLTWHTKTIKFTKKLEIGPKTVSSSWPPTVKRLMQKYDFLYDYTVEKGKASTVKGLKGSTEKGKASTVKRLKGYTEEYQSDWFES